MSTYRSSRWAAQILALHLGLCSACAGPSPAPVPAPQPAAPAPRPAPADTSLSTQEYVQIGVPDPARPWTGEDVRQAVRALTDLVQRRPNALPRHESARSGAVFARLTAAENVETVAARKGTLEVRTRAALPFVEAAVPLFRLYQTAYEQGSVTSDDVIELLGWEFRCLAALLDLAAEAAPRLDPEDPEHAARLQGFERARASAGQAVAFTIRALRATDDITPSERRLLLTQLQETLPTILPLLTAGVQTELLTSLRQLDADPALADLDPDLGFLIDESERAAASSTPPTS